MRKLTSQPVELNYLVLTFYIPGLLMTYKNQVTVPISTISYLQKHCMHNYISTLFLWIFYNWPIYFYISFTSTLYIITYNIRVSAKDILSKWNDLFYIHIYILNQKIIKAPSVTNEILINFGRAGWGLSDRDCCLVLV